MQRLMTVLIILMAIGTSQAEENKVLQAVQIRMAQASKLYQMGDKDKAKQLVDESIDIMITSIRNGKGQAWMREGLKVAMKVNQVSEIEIQSVMKQVDSYMGTVRPLSLREKLNSLTDTSAVKELARDRRRAALGGMFLGQKNDLQVRKIISFQFRNDFLHKKMISKELKNDFREMIFGTFGAGFEDVIYSWEKNHFLRKWAFPEMDGNHFFPENAQYPP